MHSISEKWNLYQQVHPLFTYDLTCSAFVCIYGTFALISGLVVFGLWIPFSILIGSLTEYGQIVTLLMIICPITVIVMELCLCVFKTPYGKDCVSFCKSGCDFFVFMKSGNPHEHIADQG